MQIKNEKSCARSMSDEDLVRAMRPDLTAVSPFMFHVCNISSLHTCTIFNLHVLFLICSKIFNLQVKFLVCSNIFNLHVWPFWPPYDSDAADQTKFKRRKKINTHFSQTACKIQLLLMFNLCIRLGTWKLKHVLFSDHSNFSKPFLLKMYWCC